VLHVWMGTWVPEAGVVRLAVCMLRWAGAGQEGRPRFSSARYLHYCITVLFVVFRNMEMNAGSLVIGEIENRKYMHCPDQPYFKVANISLTHIYAV
jgi:hypothetical protein